MRRLLSKKRKKPLNGRALKSKWGNCVTEDRVVLCSECWWHVEYGERLSSVHVSLAIRLPGIALMRVILEESSELQPGWTEVSEEWQGRNLRQFIEDAPEEKNRHVFERYYKVKSGDKNGNPLQCSCLENPVEEPGGLLSIGSHRVGQDWSDLACTHALEKEMTTHSGILAWRIPGTEEAGGLQSMALHRVRHDWSNLAAAAAFFTVQLSHPYMTTGKTIRGFK